MNRNYFITKSKKSIIISLFFNILSLTIYILNYTRDLAKNFDPVLLIIFILLVIFFIYVTISEFIQYKNYQTKPVLSINNESLSYLKRFTHKTININDIDSILNDRHNRFFVYLNDDSGLDLGFTGLSDDEISETIHYLKTINNSIKVNR